MHGSPEERQGEVGRVGGVGRGVKTRGGLRTKRGFVGGTSITSTAICCLQDTQQKGQRTNRFTGTIGFHMLMQPGAVPAGSIAQHRSWEPGATGLVGDFD